MTREEIQGQINACLNLLQNTDYKAIKHADGAISDEEYADTNTLRASYRQAINDLEAQLAALPAE